MGPRLLKNDGNDPTSAATIARAISVLSITFALAYAAADTRTRPLVINTILLAGGAGLLSMPFGILVALYIERTELRGRRFTATLATLMLFFPAYLQIAGWEAGFGLQGWFCRWMFPSEPIAVLAGWPGALWTQTLLNLPWIILIVRLGLLTSPSQIEAQASLDAPARTVIVCVTLPAVRWAILAAWLWVFVLAAADITVTDVYQIRTFAEELYTGFAIGDDLSTAPIRNLPGSLLVAGIALSALIACREFTQRLHSVGETAGWRIRPRPGWTRSIIALTILASMLLWLGVPIVNLLFQAGLEVTAIGEARVRGWSAAKAFRMVASAPIRFKDEFAWSLALAQVTSVSVAFVAIALAWQGRAVEPLRSKLATVLGWTLTIFGLAAPGPIVALTLSKWVNQPSMSTFSYVFDRTLFLPWLALAIRTFPFAFLIAHWAVHRVNTRLLEIADVHGAGRWQRFRFVIWPQLGQSIGWLWVLVIASCVADLSATVLAVPPGVTTVAIRIFNLVHYGVSDQLAGLCLGSMCVFTLVASCVLALLPNHEKR